MAKQLIKKDKTSRIEYVWIQDSSSSTGAALTGLVFDSSGLSAYYVRAQGSATIINLATQTVTGAYSSGGFVEVDATNMPGLYRFDVPNAVFATGVDKAVVELKGATNMAPVVLEYQLVNFDPEDGAALGLTAVVVGTNNDKTGYSVASNGIGSGAIAAAERNNVADAFLDRVMSAGADSGGDNTSARTVRQALRSCRNRVKDASGTMTVYKEDDTTPDWTSALSRSAGNPISESDPT